MLVLTRKMNESLIIGDEIEVIVLGVQGGRVRLGIRCPKEIPVHREEVRRRIANAELLEGAHLEAVV